MKERFSSIMFSEFRRWTTTPWPILIIPYFTLFVAGFIFLGYFLTLTFSPEELQKIDPKSPLSAIQSGFFVSLLVAAALISPDFSGGYMRFLRLRSANVFPIMAAKAIIGSFIVFIAAITMITAAAVTLALTLGRHGVPFLPADFLSMMLGHIIAWQLLVLYATAINFMFRGPLGSLIPYFIIWWSIQMVDPFIDALIPAPIRFTFGSNFRALNNEHASGGELVVAMIVMICWISIATAAAWLVWRHEWRVGEFLNRLRRPPKKKTDNLKKLSKIK